MSIINRNRNNTNQIVKTTQIVECMVILASVLILSLNSSCSNSRHNVEVISSDSLWYDAERIELDAFLGDDQTRITHAAFDLIKEKVSKYMQLVRDMGYTHVEGCIWYVEKDRFVAVE